MPVKNAAPWLEACILSIQKQKFVDWQLVAIDDFSTDVSVEIIEKFSRLDERVIVLKNQKPGITHALQLAFENCTGTYISRMDADDLMPPKKLEILLEKARKNHDAVVTGKVKYFGEAPISDGYLAYQNWLNTRVENNDFHKHIFRECVLASPNWLTHRKNVEDILPFSAHTYPEDYDLVFRWVKNGVKIIGVPEKTHLWREHQKRTSRTSALYNQQHFFNLKLHWFLKLMHSTNKNVVVFGENSKAQICTRYLTERKIKFVQIKKNNVHELSMLENPLVLCAVYDEKQNPKIEKFFNDLKLQIGENWWHV